MTLARLEDVITFKKGKKPKRLVGADQVGALPYILIENFEGRLSSFTDDEGCPVTQVSDTLLVCDGARTGLACTGLHGYVGSTLATLRPEMSKLDSGYLFYFIKGSYALLNSRTKGAAIPHLDKDLLLGLSLPLPPLPEQRRIVDFLSRAEGIVRLRREAEKKAAELIPALFLDMFGDPATNPKGWTVANLGEHVEIPSVVRTPDLIKDADHPCIGADSIESHTGKLIGITMVKNVKPKSGKYWFDTGDVLYSKIRPYLAKASLAPVGGYCSADMYPLRCKPSLHADFLLGLLLSTAFTDYATAESVRAQMPKLNRETLFSYRFPVPSMKLQLHFSEQAFAVRSIQIQQVAATTKAQATFDVLLAQAFSI